MDSMQAECLVIRQTGCPSRHQPNRSGEGER